MKYLTGVVVAVLAVQYAYFAWLTRKARREEQLQLEVAHDAITDGQMSQGMKGLRDAGCRVLSENHLVSKRVDCQCRVCREWHRRQGEPMPVAMDAQ